MACESSYTDCIRRRWLSNVPAEVLAQEAVAADECRLPPGLGRAGQSASTGLYSLSNHCWTERPYDKTASANSQLLGC